MNVFITIDAASTMGAVSTMSAVSTIDAVSTMSAVSTIDAVSTMGAASFLEFKIFEVIPLWSLPLIISAFLVFIIMALSWVFHAEKEVKKKKHHVPSSHEVVIELQRELLKSMKSSSKQTWLQIMLTIFFISVSILGGAVVLGFFQNIKDFCEPWIAQFIEYIVELLSQ